MLCRHLPQTMDASPDYYTQQNFQSLDGQNKIFHERNRFKQYLAIDTVIHKEGELQSKDVPDSGLLRRRLLAWACFNGGRGYILEVYQSLPGVILGQEQGCVPTPSLHVGIWAELSPHRSHAHCHSQCEFICAAALLCLEDAVSLESSPHCLWL